MEPLARILQPLSLEIFFAEHWGRRVLHLPAEDGGDRFAGFPERDDLPALLFGDMTSAGSPGATGMSMCAIKDPSGEDLNLAMPYSQTGPLYAAGASLGFPSIDGACPAIRAVCDCLEARSPISGGSSATCFLSPPRSGSPIHFDATHVFLCQVSGEKHWTISGRRAIENPVFGAHDALLQSDGLGDGLAELGYRVRRPPECELQELMLRPGDLLYLPPGTYHRAQTRDSHSLHYTIGVNPTSFWEVVFPALRLMSFHSAEMRQEVDDLAPDEQRAALARRLQELKDRVDQLTVDALLEAFEQTGELPIAGMFRG